MPVSDVWLTPSSSKTPRWWKVSSGLVFIVVAACSKLLLGKKNSFSFCLIFSVITRICSFYQVLFGMWTVLSLARILAVLVSKNKKQNKKKTKKQQKNKTCSAPSKVLGKGTE